MGVMLCSLAYYNLDAQDVLSFREHHRRERLELTSA